MAAEVGLNNKGVVVGELTETSASWSTGSDERRLTGLSELAACSEFGFG